MDNGLVYLASVKLMTLSMFYLFVCVVRETAGQQITVNTDMAELDDADFGDVKDLSLFAFLKPDELGAWPLLMLEPDNQPHEHASLEHLIGTLAALQVHSFVDIYVTQDERNSSQYILQVSLFCFK